MAGYHAENSTISKDQPMIIGTDLSGFLTGDAARSIAFYRDVLGMTPTATDDEGRGAEFTLADGSTFGVWNMGDGTSSGAMVMFAVENVNDAIAEMRKRGATLSDQMESPVCHMSFGEDPDGNKFVIHQRKVRD
jgi:predicted enzyme related to lactoylglutathione lyase